MPISPDYVLAKMQVEKTRARNPTKTSRKVLPNPSAPGHLVGTPMSVPAEYVSAKIKAGESRAQTAAVGAFTRKQYYTPSRDSNSPSVEFLGSPGAVPAEYVLANMKAKESRAQAKAAGVPSGKRYYTPSRDRNTASTHMIGSTMAVPAEYVFSKMQAEKSDALYTPATVTSERQSSTLPRTSDLSSSLPVGTPMAVPAEYVWAKEQERQSREQSRAPSLSSGTSEFESRSSAETTYSYEKPAVVGKRSLGLRIKEYVY